MLANLAERTPTYQKTTPSPQWNQSKPTINELDVIYFTSWVWCSAKRNGSEDGENRCLWPFGLHPNTLTSSPLYFLCFYSASTIIREGKAHCCILTDPCLRAEHSWRLCIGTAAFARLNTAMFTPCQYAYSVQPLSQPGHHAQYSPNTMPTLTHSARLVWPHAWQPPPPFRPTLLAPDWTQEPTPVCCHFATNSVWVFSGHFRFN